MKSRSQKIKSFNRKAGRPAIIEFTPALRERFKRLYMGEVSDMSRVTAKYISPHLDELVQRQNADSQMDIFKRFQRYFREANIAYFGSVVTGGEPNVVQYGTQMAKKFTPVVKTANEQHKKQFRRNFRKLVGVDPIQNEAGIKNELTLMVKENVKRITTLSTEYFDDIESTIITSIRSGSASDTVIAEIQKYIDKSLSNTGARASLIATDQMNKLSGNLDMIRQRANGGNRYIWMTRGNARVRQDHQDLEGAVFEWGHPPITVTTGKRAGERNHPKGDINCFCYASMVIEDLTGKKTQRLVDAEAKTAKLKSRGRI